jgi:hypothetical protein
MRTVRLLHSVVAATAKATSSRPLSGRATPSGQVKASEAKVSDVVSAVSAKLQTLKVTRDIQKSQRPVPAAAAVSMLRRPASGAAPSVQPVRGQMRTASKAAVLAAPVASVHSVVTSPAKSADSDSDDVGLIDSDDSGNDEGDDNDPPDHVHPSRLMWGETGGAAALEVSALALQLPAGSIQDVDLHALDSSMSLFTQQDINLDSLDTSRLYTHRGDK